MSVLFFKRSQEQGQEVNLEIMYSGNGMHSGDEISFNLTSFGVRMNHHV